MENKVELNEVTLTITPSHFARIVRCEMAIELLRGLVEKTDYLLKEEVERILNAVEEEC